MFTRLTLIVAIFASVTLGCGEDSQGNNGIFNNVQKDTGGEDMDGSDAGTDMDRPEGPRVQPDPQERACDWNERPPTQPDAAPNG